MSFRRASVLCLLTCLAAHAQARKVDFQAAGSPLAVQPADPQIAAALRNVSAVEMRKTIEALVSFNNRNTAGGDETTLPQGQGVRAAAAWVHARFQTISDACGGCLEIHEDEFTQPAQTTANPRIKKPTTLVNVYAVMKGSDPAQTARRILVTGHYDSFFTRDMQNTQDPAPGANDDASGTAVSLECARVLSKLHLPATIVFAAVTGEEQGLLGSAHLAKVAKAEGWDLEGVLNNDIVGGDTTPADLANEDKHRVRIFSEGISLAATPQLVQRTLSVGEESDSASRQLARATADVARTYTESTSPKAAINALHPVLILRLDRYLRGGDHSAFNREGFPGIRFTEWRENFDHQHQPVRVENGVQFGDLIQFDDFEYMARVARINAAALATLATAPAPPAAVTMLTRNLNNDSVLTWTQPANTLPGATYEVLWRQTDASGWQYSAPAAQFAQKIDGNTYTVTIPVSKDNVLFGVRACDSKGHCSPAAAPLPR
jgi:Zn-dependent M28 family amino/carboxypeptidase